VTSDSNLDATKTSALILLLAADFLLFYETAFGGSFANFISEGLTTFMPFLANIPQVIPYLLFGLFVALMLLIYAIRKIILFSVISFLLFLPAAISTPSINWSETNILNLPTFFLIVSGGIIMLSCLTVLNFTTKLSETRRELISRGANIAEVNAVISGGLSLMMKIVLGSAALTTTAILVYVFAQPLEIQIIQSTFTYLPFVLGVVAALTIALLIFYYFRRHDSSQ
jgi:hypothetical protein